MEVRGNYLKQDKVTFIHGNVVRLFVVYELDTCLIDLNAKIILDDCLLGAAKLTKNADPDNYGYHGYGFGFDAPSKFSLNLFK